MDKKTKERLNNILISVLSNEKSIEKKKEIKAQFKELLEIVESKVQKRAKKI